MSNIHCKRSQRGLSMILVMFFALLATVLASTFAVMAFAPTGLTRAVDQHGQCELLTTQVLNMAFARLKEDPSFAGTVEVGDARAWAVVTFEPSEAARRGVPVSVNRASALKPGLGSEGRTLPSHSVQLFARAKVGSSTMVVENVLHAPPFRYCIASSGFVSCTGPMLVAGVPSFEGTLPASLDPGHVAGNGDVSLVGPSTVVTGDVKAAGAVSSGNGVVVEGQVEPAHSAVVLPAIDVASYDPGASNPAARHLVNNYPGLTVDTLTRCEGDLTITVTGLNLEHGLLYVNGNLVVHGGVSGTGAIICTGNVELDGGGALATSNLAAVIAGGDVVVNGTGQDSSFFRGLIYTEGNFTARAVTLVGAFVGNSSAPGGCRMQLDNVRAVYDPQAVAFEMKFPFGYSESVGRGMSTPNSPTPVTPDLTEFYDSNTDSYVQKRELLTDVQYLYRGRPYSRSELKNLLGREDPPSGYSDWNAALDAAEADFRQNLTDQITDIADRYARTRDAALRDGKFSLDLNKFLSVTDRVRVVFWRDLN